MRIFIMFTLNLQWLEKENTPPENFYDGEEVLCVKTDGLVYKLAFNEEKECFVDRLGNEHNYDDFVEFCEMRVE